MGLHSLGAYVILFMVKLDHEKESVMAYSKIPVPIPFYTNRIIRDTEKGTTYIKYTYDVDYNPVTKKNNQKRQVIGKMCEDNPEMMYPNSHYKTYFPDAEEIVLSRDKPGSFLKCGSFLLLQKAIIDNQLPEILQPILGEDTGFFLDLAMYMVVTDSNVMQFYNDYARFHPVMTKKRKVYSDSTASDFFKKLANGQSYQFLNAWNERMNKDEVIYISYDSTNKRCQAGDIDISEFGGNPKQGEGPIFNLSLGYDHTNEIPLFYENYSGTIIDMQQLKYMQEKAASYGYKNVGYILDRGYFSKANIRYMDDNGIAYIIMVKGMKDWIKNLVLDNLDMLKHGGKGRIREVGINVLDLHTEIHNFAVGEKWCHLYFSLELADKERKKLDKEIAEMELELAGLKFKKGYEGNWKRFQKYYNLEFAMGEDGRDILVMYSEKEAEVDEAYNLLGYFVIITSEEMSGKEAYFLYKSRDEIEKLFRTDKSFAPCERTHTGASLIGKQFVEFVTLILYNYLMRRLSRAYTKNLTHPNYFSVNGAIHEMEKILMPLMTDGTYKLESAISKEQRNILEVFGLDDAYVRKHARTIGDIYSGKNPGSLITLKTYEKPASKSSK